MEKRKRRDEKIKEQGAKTRGDEENSPREER